MLTPRWIYKLRWGRGKLGTERLVRIPPEIADQLGEYVKITLVDGKLVIEPYNEDSTNASSQEVS
ncbi:MAG: AbrB/MazE/SpoVT family DNA-binding domain-containing protein [Archaeoglobaceae archaeon]